MRDKRELWLLTSKDLLIYSDSSGAITAVMTHLVPVNSPITLLAKEVLMSVARPRSPIFTEPVGPVIKMLSHFRSRCTIGGVRVCRKCRPFRICLHQLRNTFGFITLKRLRYLLSTQQSQHSNQSQHFTTSSVTQIWNMSGLTAICFSFLFFFFNPCSSPS